MAETPRVLEIFSDYTCPFCYFNMESAEKLAKEFEIPIRWRCFPLHPEVPRDGIRLEDLLNVPSSEVEKWGREFAKAASQLGLPFKPLGKTYNSRMAQELGQWASDQGKGHAYHMAAFQAFFAKGLNIASHDILLDIAEAAGLPRDEAGEVLTERTYNEAVDKDWDLARTMKITAVPTMVYGENRLIGAKSYEKMAALISSANGQLL
ncbi:MAG: DsbA family protein [Desulfatibacillum sp.]|nr:DsbA family protein [Desulfatibacillum sp.]